MVLRDLTKRQLYNLRRKSQKQQKEWLKKQGRLGKYMSDDEQWEAAFNAGLKAGLAIKPNVLSP